MKLAGLNKTERVALLEFASKLHKRFPNNILSIKLYGSKARGTANKDSDIDVLLIVKNKIDEVNETVLDLVCEILNEYGVYIETVTLTKNSYMTALSRQYPFVLNVERDSIQL